MFNKYVSLEKHEAEISASTNDDLSMFQQTCSASTPLFSPPSKLHILSSVGTRGAVRALRFRACDEFKKLDATGTDCKIFNGDLSPVYNQKSNAGGNISRILVQAGSYIPLESGPELALSSSTKTTWESVKHGLDVFQRFIKPYTILGTIIHVLSMSLFAMDKFSDFSPLYVKGVCKAMVAAILMSIYIVGINQLTDIDIDRVNKPSRPLASGEYSYKTGSLIVAFSAILSFGIASIEGSVPLFGVIIGNFLLGTIYSVNLPLLRWKKYPFLAALCIVTHCGVIQPVSYYLHFQAHLLQKSYNFPKSLMFTSALLGFFGMILTLAKDIPDVEGDTKYGVDSYAARFGQKRVFWACVILLEMVYGAAIVVGARSTNIWSKLILVLGHCVMAVVLWSRAKQTNITNITNPDTGEAFYMFLWKLHFAEAVLIPFIRL